MADRALPPTDLLAAGAGRSGPWRRRRPPPGCLREGLPWSGRLSRRVVAADVDLSDCPARGIQPEALVVAAQAGRDTYRAGDKRKRKWPAGAAEGDAGGPCGVTVRTGVARREPGAR